MKTMKFASTMATIALASVSAPVLAQSPATSQTPLSIEKTVEPALPVAGQPVEFTITVLNEGTDVETGIEVTDSLPNGLSIPAGMAPFTSQGNYDVQTGVWSVGDVAADANAVLTIPAQRDIVQPCLVNVAQLQPSSTDPIRGDLALAAVRDNDVVRCVDVSASSLGLIAIPPFCSTGTTARIVVSVANNGPDMASQVILRASDIPNTIPNMRFESCPGNDPLECTVPPLAAGGAWNATLVSDQFENASSFTASVTFAVTTIDEDYAPANNDLVVTGNIPSTSNPPCDIDVPSSGGCFIATAAFGASWDNNVVTLMRFRDEVLLHNTAGRHFVAWYYRTSPPIADYIRERPALRATVRFGLTPVVKSIRYPWMAPSALALLIAGLITWRRRKTKDVHNVRTFLLPAHHCSRETLVAGV